MQRTLIVLLIPFLLSLAVYSAAGNSVTGKWDCTSTDQSGNSIAWILDVKEDGGKLAARLIGDGVEIKALEPKLQADSFTFKVRINENEVIDVVTKVDGNRLDGKFKGADSGTGTFRGTRQN